MLDINLEKGKKVTVNAFSMNFTYGGLLTYQTSEDINRKLFERASYPSNWNNRAVLKIKPKEANFKSFLDSCYYCVWLSSTWKQNNQSDGSELVVIWFDDIPNQRSIEHIITYGIKNIDWEDHAEGFCF